MVYEITMSDNLQLALQSIPRKVRTRLIKEGHARLRNNPAGCVINGQRVPVVSGTDRGEPRWPCGDAENGWVSLFNWNLLAMPEVR